MSSCADAQLAEASLRLRQKLVLPREVLFSAPRRYQQKQQQGAGATGLLADQKAPGQLPPGGPAASGKIIR